MQEKCQILIDFCPNFGLVIIRAESPEEKIYWLDVLSGLQTGPETLLKRYPSTLSIQSTLSTNSIASLSRTLNEKLHEIETYRDILFEQVSY
jgi:collagen type IV alpha-3-binding protein